jgi:cytochrome c
MRGLLTGFAGVALAIAVSGAALADEGADLDKGKKIFARCQACHTLDEGGANRIGPNLHGIFGRKAGALEGFSYSKAMAAKGAEGLVWNEETLTQYLHKPAAMIPGTAMAFPGLRKDDEIANLIAYLKVETGAH